MQTGQETGRKGLSWAAVTSWARGLRKGAQQEHQPSQGIENKGAYLCILHAFASCSFIIFILRPGWLIRAIWGCGKDSHHLYELQVVAN